MHLLLLITTVICTGLAEDRHLVQYKSAHRTFAECRQILGPSPTQCENYCAAVLTHFWDFRNASIDPVHFARFMHQDEPVPEQYFAEFERCAEQVRAVVPAWEPCQRADLYLGCLSRNGSVNANQLFYNVKTPLRHQRVAQDCVVILGITGRELDGMLGSGLVNDSRGRCLIRCFLIREKLYSEANGVNSFRVLIERDELRNHRESREDGRTCVAGLQREFLDRCTLAARIAAECYEGELLEIVERSLRELFAGNQIKTKH